MIRTFRKTDRRRKPAPRWEPSVSLPMSQRVSAALKLADQLQNLQKKENPNAR